MAHTSAERTSPKPGNDARARYEEHPWPLMQSDCTDCHVDGADASDSTFVLSGDTGAGSLATISMLMGAGGKT